MKSIRVSPSGSIDPSFRTAKEAIAWESARSPAALADSELLKGRYVTGLEIYADSVWLFLDEDGPPATLSLSAREDSTAWCLLFDSPWPNSNGRGKRRLPDDVRLEWPSFSTIWHATAELSELIGKRLSGLRASDSRIWLYPSDYHPPLEFCSIIETRTGLPLLYWQWEKI